MDENILMISLIGMIVFLLFVLFIMILFLVRSGKNSRVDVLYGNIERMLQQQDDSNDKIEQRFRNMTEEQGKSRHQLEEKFEGVSSRISQHLSNQSQQSLDTLGTLREALSRLETEQKKMIDLGGYLQGEVSFLREVLSNRPARGAYGEIRLYDMISSVLPSQMIEYQKTLSNRTRVDCLIKLPQPTGAIPIDAKFPLETFQKVLESENKKEHKESLAEFARIIKRHIYDISEKYLIPGETADIALMFIPSEAVYSEIHDHSEEVVNYAWERRVFMVSPTTMMAVLSSVRALMRHITSHKQALEVQKIVGGLKKDMERLGYRIDNLGRHFEQAQKDINEISISKNKIGQHAEKISSVELLEPEPEPNRLEQKSNNLLE